jgi:hypothetical protein
MGSIIKRLIQAERRQTRVNQVDINQRLMRTSSAARGNPCAKCPRLSRFRNFGF